MTDGLQPESPTLFECVTRISRQGGSEKQWFVATTETETVAGAVRMQLELLTEFTKNEKGMWGVVVILDDQERKELAPGCPMRPFVSTVLVRTKGSPQCDWYELEISGLPIFAMAIEIAVTIVLQMRDQAAEIEKDILKTASS